MAGLLRAWMAVFVPVIVQPVAWIGQYSRYQCVRWPSSWAGIYLPGDGAALQLHEGVVHVRDRDQ